MKLPVAVQLYSVRDEMERDVYGTLRKMKEFGYDGVEFAGLFGEAPEKLKAFCAEIGLVPISAHVPYDDMLADPAGVLGDYAALGCKYVAVPYLTEEHRPGTAGFAATVAGIRKIAEAAKTLGIQLLYHNHDFEFVKIDGHYALDVLYASIPADLLQTEFDTCWVKVAGEDPVAYLKKYAGRSPVVHLKDFEKHGNAGGQLYQLIGIEEEGEQAEAGSFTFKPVGSGMQDFPSILAASVEAGAQWVVVEQDEPAAGDTRLDSVKQSRDYLLSLGW